MGFAQGLRAVNNNVQQVFTALALGSTQAGGFKNLLATMRGQLIGPGGLILLFSALSAGLEIFVTQAQKAKVSASDLSESISNLITSTSDIKQLELNYDVVNQAVIDQEKIVERLAKDVEGSVLRGEGALRASGGLSQAAVDNMREAGLTELQIQRLRRGGLEAGKQELAVQRAILEDLSDRRLKIETDMRVANAMRQNEAIETHRQETEALGEIDDLVDAGNKLKLEGLSIDEQLKRLDADRTEAARLQKEQNAELPPILEAQLELFELIKEFEEAAAKSAKEKAEREEQILRARLEGVERARSQAGSGEIEMLPGGALDLGDPEEVLSGFDRMADSAVRAGSIISQSFGSAGSALMQLAKTGEETDMRLFKMGKRVGIAQAIVNTAVGITRAFKDLPFPAAVAASVSIAASGAAQIAAIKAAKPSGSGGTKSLGAGVIRGGMMDFNVGNLYSGTANPFTSAAGVGSLGTTTLGSRGMQIQLVARGPDLVSAVDAQRSANTRLIGGSR